MSVREPDLAGEILILKGIHYANVNFNTEMTALVTALGSDTTTHDQTIESRAVALSIREPPANSRLTNDAILLINSAKAGGLSNSQIISAIDDTLAIAHKPAVVNVPYVSSNGVIVGSVCNCTTGQWTGNPTGYTYQWKRDGATNLGTAATYTLIAADVGGHAITCVVTATNATGSQAAPPSNQIAT